MSIVIYFIALSLCCWGLGFSNCGDWGYSIVVLYTFLIVVASLVVKHGLYGSWASVTMACVLSSCGTWALEHVGFSSCVAWV